MDQIIKACNSIYIIIPAATLCGLHVTRIGGTLFTLHISLDDNLGKKKKITNNMFNVCIILS